MQSLAGISEPALYEGFSKLGVPFGYLSNKDYTGQILWDLY